MELILHHYDFSNYAEKARLALGYKSLAWRSVIIPSTAPKPDLTPLTGGYRRTPVLQIGADIFCDTRLILRELERRKPQPSLYPDGTTALADMIAYWAEHQFFRPMSLYVSGTNLDLLPPGLQADRSRMRDLPLPSAETVQRAAKRNAPFVRAQLPFIEALLTSGHAWIAGAQVTVADFAVYHPLWFMTARSQRLAHELAPYPRITDWMGRMSAFGHGASSPMSAAEALDIAAAAQPATHFACHFQRTGMLSLHKRDFARPACGGSALALKCPIRANFSNLWVYSFFQNPTKLTSKSKANW